MRICFALIGLLVASNAYAFETHASLTGGTGYDYYQEDSYVKAGFVLSAPLGLGFGWWSYSGVGNTAEDEMWACHTEGVDWTYQRLTSGFTYKVSKDPDHFYNNKYKFQQELGVNVKIKLW